VQPGQPTGLLQKIGRTPQRQKGGEPKNLSHPIVYVVNPKSPNAQLAAMLVAYASLPYYNTQHAVTTAHTGILNGQESMPDYKTAWYLGAATPLLARSTFIPNHPDFPGTTNTWLRWRRFAFTPTNVQFLEDG
jgi:inositol-phosphate transport system substrate-binding protein